jgi:hypothetical protein
MNEEQISRFQALYHKLFMNYMDILFEQAGAKERESIKENMLTSFYPDVREFAQQILDRPMVPMSQQLEEAEKYYEFLQRSVNVINSYEQIFTKSIKDQDRQDDLASRAVILCERYETEFAIASQRPSQGMRRGSGRGSTAFSPQP